MSLVCHYTDVIEMSLFYIYIYIYIYIYKQPCSIDSFRCPVFPVPSSFLIVPSSQSLDEKAWQYTLPDKKLRF